MTEISIPESFQARPYARESYTRMARWALANHPFYKKHVTDPSRPFPVITRLEVQGDNDLLLNGFAPTGRTSGSTSTPIEISWSPQRSAMEKRDTALFVGWMGGPLPHMKLVSLTSHAKNDWTLDVIEPMPVQVEFMQGRHRVAGACALITYPGNLERLCQYIIDNDIDMSFLRRCVCLAEAYEPYHDALLKQAFPNAVASATYSSVEFGMIAARCPHQPDNFHIMAHKVGVEFLNQQGLPCRDGEVGQVVLTDYSNRRSTLIRYALGDLAAPTTCACGKIQLPAMTQILGKVWSALKDATGRPIAFTGVSTMFRDSPEIRQFQVVQPALGHFVIRYVPRGQVDLVPFMARVRDHFEQAYGEVSRLEFEPMTEIPRTAGGKFFGAICLA